MKPKTEGAHLLSIKEVASKLNVSTRTIRRWIDGKELVAHRLGRQWRITREDLETYLRRRRSADVPYGL